MIEDVLARSQMEREQIEVLAVGLGPGSYTGIRVALSMAQGWQLARGGEIARREQRGMSGGAGAGGKNFRPRERGD